MNRIQIRRRVQNLLRDDNNSFPIEAINESLNRVLGDINGMGRFTFQETTGTIPLVNGTYKYTISTILGTSFRAEEMLVYKLGNSADQAILTKVTDAFNAVSNGLFLTSGIPSAYIRFGDQFWFDPVPNATAGGNNVSVLYYADITDLTNDLAVPGIPVRWHGNLLVYGVVSDLSPGLMVRTPEGAMKAEIAYKNAVRNFKTEEGWDPYTDKRLLRDGRWTDFELIGNVSKIR